MSSYSGTYFLYGSEMTTDFLVTVNLESGGTQDYARTVKPARELQDRRILEKFDIERRYWLEREVDWKMVTERDIPLAFAKNAGAFRAHRNIDDRVTITAQRIAEIAHWITEQVQQGAVISWHGCCKVRPMPR
jgi:hypothetical protein